MSWTFCRLWCSWSCSIWCSVRAWCSLSWVACLLFSLRVWCPAHNKQYYASMTRRLATQFFLDLEEHPIHAYTHPAHTPHTPKGEKQKQQHCHKQAFTFASKVIGQVSSVPKFQNGNKYLSVSAFICSSLAAFSCRCCRPRDGLGELHGSMHVHDDGPKQTRTKKHMYETGSK